MGMRPALAALVSVLAIGAIASPAQAGRWTALGSFTSPPIAAGDGRVVAGLGDHGVALIGPRGIERQYDLGPGCSVTRTAGASRALVGCVAKPLDPSLANRKVLDLATGQLSALTLTPAAARMLDAEYATFAGVGRTWLEVQGVGNHYFARNYWNPSTGEVVESSWSKRRVADLDAARPETRICSPVIRPRNPATEDEDGFAPFKRTGKFSVFVRWHDHTLSAELFAWRCGRRRAVRVSGCSDADQVYDQLPSGPASCADFDARDDLVAWPVDHGVRLMDLRSGRRFRIPGDAATGPFTNVVLGRGDKVYASTPPDSSHTVSLFVARAR